MPEENRCKLLADEILKILQKGLTLSGDVVHYIDSTFSHPTIEELEDILADDSNCEKDSLVELLFFPDESMQVELEGFIESNHFKKEDEGKVLEYLCQKPLLVSFLSPRLHGASDCPCGPPLTCQGTSTDLSDSDYL